MIAIDFNLMTETFQDNHVSFNCWAGVIWIQYQIFPELRGTCVIHDTEETQKF